MTSAEFLLRCEDLFPGKPLTPSQSSVYHEKLARFDSRQLSKILAACLENCKFFPKIADIYEQAGEFGYLDVREEYKPHTWTETACAKCAGSGLMAAGYTQEFEKTEAGAVQVLTLVHVGPYHKSVDWYRGNTDGVRQAFRCKCPAGEAKTLQQGLPRWPDEPNVHIRRSWG